MADVYHALHTLLLRINNVYVMMDTNSMLNSLIANSYVVRTKLILIISVSVLMASFYTRINVCHARNIPTTNMKNVFAILIMSGTIVNSNASLQTQHALLDLNGTKRNWFVNAPIKARI